MWDPPIRALAAGAAGAPLLRRPICSTQIGRRIFFPGTGPRGRRCSFPRLGPARRGPPTGPGARRAGTATGPMVAHGERAWPPTPDRSTRQSLGRRRGPPRTGPPHGPGGRPRAQAPLPGPLPSPRDRPSAPASPQWFWATTLLDSRPPRDPGRAPGPPGRRRQDGAMLRRRPRELSRPRPGRPVRPRRPPSAPSSFNDRPSPSRLEPPRVE